MSQAGNFNRAIGTGIVDFLEGNTGGPVGPNGSNVIFVVGSGLITVTGDPLTNTLTISNTGLASFLRISTSQLLTVNTGYACVGGGVLVLTLPPVSNLGDLIQLTLDGSTGFVIAQGAGQSVRFGNKQTTAGTGGSITSTAQGDSLLLRCTLADARWNVFSSMGNPTVI